jgi:hypothetical protein
MKVMMMNFKIEDDRFHTYRYPTSDPRRIWLSPSQFHEGAAFAKKQNINNFFIFRGDETLTKYVDLDLSWLKDFPNTYGLEIMLNPSKNSCIDSLYDLHNLQYLVYFGYDKKPLDHFCLQSLKSLYTHYDTSQLDGDSSFQHLINLDSLKLWHIKKQTDCSFFGKLPRVKELELAWAKSLESLDGVEHLDELEIISVRNCSLLKDISALLKCKNLKRAWIESSKQLNTDAPIKLKKKGIEINGPHASAVSKILKDW